MNHKDHTNMFYYLQNTTVYKVPTISPTGVYKGKGTCATGVNHS